MIDLTLQQQNELIDRFNLNEAVFLTALASAEKRGISTDEFLTELETRHIKSVKGYDDADQYETGWRDQA